MSARGIASAMNPVRRRYGRIVAWVTLLAIVGLVWSITAYRSENFQEAILALLDRVESLGPWGPVLLVAAVTASMLLILPSFPFTLGAGFLFGVVKGTLCIFIGTVAGGSLAFFAGRFLFKDRLFRALEKRPRIRRFVGVIAQEGWRFVMFTRMVPMFPYKFSNYVFGAAKISYREFILGTCVGIVPLAATNVYAGSVLSSLSILGTDEGPESARSWMLYLAGFAIALAFSVYVAYLARKALDPFMTNHADPSEADRAS